MAREACRRYQQITDTKSYILPCLKQAQHITGKNRTSYHASYRYQNSMGNKSYMLPCLTQIPAKHRQQVAHLAMLRADNSKSRAINRSSCHASHRYQQSTGNKSYFLPYLTQLPANQRQQIVHRTMPHAVSSKSQATNHASCHASHRYQQITGNKSYITQIAANPRQQNVLLAMPPIDTRE